MRAQPLKTCRSAQGSAFWGLNDVPLNFGGKYPQNWNFGAVNRTFKPEQENIQILITWKLPIRSWQKFLQEVRATNEASWVVSWLTQTNPRWRRPPSLISEKISITSDWIKMSAPNFMGRCITAMQRWPRDQKSKPEVNSRDVIKWRSEAYMRRSQWLYLNQNWYRKQIPHNQHAGMAKFI